MNRPLLGALPLLAAFSMLFTMLFTAAWAQDLSAEEIIDRLQESGENLQDASFLLTGRIIDADGTTINLEIEVEVIPDEELARAEFIQPDALADNYVILDGDVVYNYLFLTNQVTILNANDPDALGGLLPQSDANLEDAAESFDFTFSLDELFEGWEVTVEGYQPSPVGDVYLLRFENQEIDANISHVNAQVVDEEWRPYRLEFIQTDGRMLAELVITQWQRDQGLKPADLRHLPPDAELIDER
jgi:outer membrane lipoprotein-sorting protein